MTSPSTLGPLVGLVEALEAGDLEAAALQAVVTFVELEREDTHARAWCQALYGVVESRRGEWASALEALDEAHSLAVDAGDEVLQRRILIDRLLPLSHHRPSALPEALATTRDRLAEEPELLPMLVQVEARLPLTSPGAPVRLAMPSTLRLVTENHPVELTLPLRGTVLRIGRRRSCDLQIRADAEVSRIHAQLEVREDGWHVIDVSTTGRTRVLGCANATGPLEPGARVEVGGTVLAVCA